MRLFQSVRRGIFLLLSACCLSLHSTPAAAQANIEVFGQNRVQYRKYDWKFFDTKHFRVYHYDRSGIALARYVAEQAERDIATIERRMSGTFPHRFNIVLYNSYDEYRQTNIGLRFDNQIEGTATGTVDIVGDKLVVYFSGIHTDLRRQIRAGMSQVILQRSLFGENFREVVKNSLFLSLPAWVSQGYLAYVVDGWDAPTESAWKAEIEADSNAKFFNLAERNPELAGKAFWKWVDDHYGNGDPKALLYAIQMRSSLNQGSKMVLGLRITKAYDSCIAWYRQAFALDTPRQERPAADSAVLTIKMPKDDGIIKSFRVSPRGNDVAYCIFKDGEYFIYLQRTANEQVRSLILREGAPDFNETIADPDYPIMAWSSNGYKLAIVYRHKTETRLRIYNSQKARIENYIIPASRFDRVTGMAFNEDNDQIIFSTIRKSQTDLYSFTIKGSRLTPITNDVWDDVQPQWISGGSRRGILFLSNRPAPNMNVPAGVNELPTGPMNVFFYDTKTKSPILLQCSYNPGGNITQPIQYGPDNFAFLMDTNGVQNKYVVTFVRKGNNYDSAVPVPVTNYSTSILNHQYNAAGSQVADVLQVGHTYKVYYGPVLIPGKNAEAKTLSPTVLHGGALKVARNAAGEVRLSGSDGPMKMKRGKTFRSEFPDADSSSGSSATIPDVSQTLSRAQPSPDTDMVLNPFIKDSTYLKLKSQNYRLSFKPDFFQARLDNTILFTQYQSAALLGDKYANPSLGGLLSLSLNDAMENHKFTGGIRLPVNFSGMTYFLQYQNFTRRIDWGLLYLRTANFYNYDVTYADSAGRPVYVNQQLGKVTSNMYQANAAYPLDRRRRINFNLALRQDVLDFKAEDTLSLTFSPQQKSYWLMSRLEYVFDNSVMRQTNIREGFRAKVYGEYLYGLSASNKGGFFNFGADFRYYKRIYRNSIFALRIATAHSEGDKHVLYFLGGVDQWLFPKSGSTPPVTDQNYAFQALGSPLRGYEQNARNGNSYALINLELRVPVISTFFRRPVQSSILRNLQLVGFTDVGSAWNGWIPTAVNTSRNYLLSSPQTPVSLNVNSFTSGGLAAGWGGGLRATLLGYFARVDFAWNVDGLRKPIIYYAIGLDF